MISVGQKSLMANGFSFFVFGFYTVYSSLFLALGKGTAGFVLGACRQGICFVPIILLLPSFWGINGILYAQPIADVISAIVTVFMALHLHKELATTKSIKASGNIIDQHRLPLRTEAISPFKKQSLPEDVTPLRVIAAFV